MRSDSVVEPQEGHHFNIKVSLISIGPIPIELVMVLILRITWAAKLLVLLLLHLLHPIVSVFYADNFLAQTQDLRLQCFNFVRRDLIILFHAIIPKCLHLVLRTWPSAMLGLSDRTLLGVGLDDHLFPLFLKSRPSSLHPCFKV